MKRYSSCKDIQKLVRRLLSEGWVFDPGRRHGRIKPKHGRGFLLVPGTPSDHRAFLNFSRAVQRLCATSRISPQGP